MTRAEYIRRKRYNRRKRRIVAYATRAAVLLVIVLGIFLIGCGCVYVKDAIWGEVNAEEEAMAGIALLASEDVQGAADAVYGQNAVDEESVPASGANGLMAEGALNKTEEEPDTYTVVLDAGHGGNDGGAFLGDIVEKDITLAVAKKMQKLLEKEDINVVMTRETDEYMELKERTQISNEGDTDLFVSIHCNSFDGGADVKGIECYYAEDDKISQKVAEMIMDGIEEKDGLRNRGAKEEDYFVTEFNDAPAVLVELGFMSNPTECKKLNESEYQQMLSEQLVDGILLSLEMLAEEPAKESAKEAR